MTAKNKKIIFFAGATVLAIAGIVLLRKAFVPTASNVITTKAEAVSFLVKALHMDANVLFTQDDGYVIGRANALNSGLTTFDFNGKKYLTANGKAL